MADNGLSDTALNLRELLAYAADFSGSISLGHHRQEARDALLQAYCNAVEENWDGEGAAAADPFSYDCAWSVLDALPSWVSNPDIYVDPDGEICLEWDYGLRSVFSVSVGRDGTLTYAALFGSGKSHGVIPFTDSLPAIITQILDRTIPPDSC